VNFQPSPSTGILLYVLGHFLIWFQLNSQFKWEYWQDREFLSTLIFAIPASLCFIFGTKNIVGHFGTLWSSRWVGYGVGITVFTFLTWYFMDESLFTWKTMSCLLLSLLIVIIQILG